MLEFKVICVLVVLNRSRTELVSPLPLCRRIRPTPAMGLAHPEVPWPEGMCLWVGPDGHPIKKRDHPLLLKWRTDLHERQQLREGPNSSRLKKVKQLGVLGLKSPGFPQVVIDPPPIDNVI